MKFWNKFEWLIVVANSLLLLFLFLLFTYSHPHSDDFSYYSFLKNNSYWDAHYLVYHFSGGRYLSTFLIFLSPLINHSIIGYQYLTACLFLFFIISFYTSFNLLFKQVLPFAQRLSLASLLLLVYLSFMPNLHEFAYWLCAEATYLTAAAFWLWILVLHSYLVKPQFAANIGLWLLLDFCTILLIGCSEIGMMLFIIPTSIHFYYRYVTQQKTPKGFWINIFIFCLVSIIIISTSGNIGRHNISPFSGNIILAIAGGFYISVSMLSKWFLILLPTAFVYLFVFGKKAQPYFEKSIRYPFLNAKNLLFFSGLFFVGAEILVCWMTGSVPEQRFQNVLFLEMLLTIIIATQLFYNRYFQTVSFAKIGHNLCWIYCICLFITIPNNYSAALCDIGLGTAAQFNQEQKNRYAIIASQKRPIIAVPPIQTKPILLYYPALSCKSVIDSNDIPRMALAEYFGKQWIYEYPCENQMPTLSLKSILKQKRNQYFSNQKQ